MRHFARHIVRMVKIDINRHFPSSPVVKTPHSQGREHGFDPWLGDLRSCMLHSIAKKKREREREINTLPSLGKNGAPHQVSKILQ